MSCRFFFAVFLDILHDYAGKLPPKNTSLYSICNQYNIILIKYYAQCTMYIILYYIVYLLCAACQCLRFLIRSEKNKKTFCKQTISIGTFRRHHNCTYPDGRYQANYAYLLELCMKSETLTRSLYFSTVFNACILIHIRMH